MKRDDGEAWFNLALIYIEEKNFDRAENAFRHSIKYKSIASADAHNNLGVIYMLNENYSVAENKFKTALNGNSIEAENNLRLCLYHREIGAKDLIANLKFSSRNTSLGV